MTEDEMVDGTTNLMDVSLSKLRELVIDRDTLDCRPPGSSVHGKNITVDCHALLQDIFPTQGCNQDLLHCRQFLYHLSHLGCPLYCL